MGKGRQGESGQAAGLPDPRGDSTIHPREANWIAGHVRHRRLALELTQHELAEKAGTTTSYICKLEGGTHVPTLRVLAKVLGALGEQLLIGSERTLPGGQVVREVRAVPQSPHVGDGGTATSSP